MLDDPIKLMAQGGQAVPGAVSSISAGGESGGPKDTAALNPEATKRAVGTAIQPTQRLQPQRPQRPRSSLAADLGLATLNMFVPMLGGAVQHHIKQQKEAQITEAVNEFASLDSALEMASTMANAEVASGKLSPDKVQDRVKELWQQQPGYRALFDPNNPAAKKRLKNFSKVFQVDWMNPEKNQNTVHYQALQRFMKLKPASAMVKMMAGGLQQAKQGAGDMAGQPQQGGPQQGAQPQGQPQQQQRPEPQMQTRQQQGDLKGLTQYGDYLKALEQHQNHFEFHAAEDGRSVAFDRRTGEAKDVVVNGKPLTLQTRAKDGVAIVDGKPVGMYRQGKLRVPGDQNWTGEDQKQFDAASATWASAEAMKDRRVRISASARARAWSATKAVHVFDPESNAMITTNMLDVSDHPGKYAPPTQAMQVLNRVSLFNEINYTSGMVRDSIGKLGDEPFPQEMRAELIVMLRQEDPKSYWQDLLKSNVADKLTENQINYITGLVSLDESALSLRSLGGMGQGSDQLRDAIIRMLPGAGTPSGKYAKRQMDLFEGEVRQLKSTLPNLGRGDGKKKSMDETINELFPKKQ